LSVNGAETGYPAGVLTPAPLKDTDLLTHERGRALVRRKISAVLANDLSGDFHLRCIVTNSGALVVSNEKHRAQVDRVTDVTGPVIDDEILTLVNLVLTTAGIDHSEHEHLRKTDPSMGRRLLGAGQWAVKRIGLVFDDFDGVSGHPRLRPSRGGV